MRAAGRERDGVRVAHAGARTGRIVLAVGLVCAALGVVPAPAGAEQQAPERLTVDLGAEAHALAVPAEGERVVVATTNGVFVIAADGSLDAHALAGLDVRAVAGNRDASLVAAGTLAGLVVILDAAGDPTGAAHVGAPVNTVALTPNGRYLVAGDDAGFVHAFDLEAGADLPAGPLAGSRLLAAAWRYRTEAAVTTVLVTPDGQWVNAQNRVSTYAFEWIAAPVPGGLYPFAEELPCVAPPEVSACWRWRAWGTGSWTALVGNRDTFDIFAGSTNGWVLGYLAQNFWHNGGNFFANGHPTSLSASTDGRRLLMGTSLGALHLLTSRPISRSALWTVPGPVRVTAVALAHDAAAAAASDEGGAVRLYDAAGGTLRWSDDAGARAAGLGFTQEGMLAGAFGEVVHLWGPAQ